MCYILTNNEQKIRNIYFEFNLLWEQTGWRSEDENEAYDAREWEREWIMLRWSEVITSEARIEALRCDAAHERWVRSMVSGVNQRPHFYYIAAFRLGGWLASAGQRIQQRYSTIAEQTLTSNIGSNQSVS